MLTRTTMGLAEGYRASLEKAGLGGFGRLMRDAAVGEVIASEPGREIRRVSLVHGGVARDFFLKRTWPDRSNPKRTRIINALRRGMMPHEAAYREYLHVAALREAGLPVMTPVAWGERRVLGVGRESFFLVEKVEGRDLALLFTEVDEKSRTRLLTALGDLLGRLHAAGFYETVRLRDVFCVDLRDGSAELPELVLIDRDTYTPLPVEPEAARCSDELARCYCKLVQQGTRMTGGQIRAAGRAYARSAAAVWRVSSRGVVKATAKDVARMTSPGRKYEGVAKEVAPMRPGRID